MPDHVNDKKAEQVMFDHRIETLKGMLDLDEAELAELATLSKVEQLVALSLLSHMPSLWKRGLRLN